LPDDIDSGNKADFESEEDTSATFAMEPLVAYLDTFYCNDATENYGEWIINEDVASDYFLCFNVVPDFISMNSLHMPFPNSMMACLQIEDNDGSVFVISSSKSNQSPIIFGRVHPRVATPVDSDKDLEPPQFFHYTWSAHHMMREMGYDLRRVEGLNFEKR